ncbi:MAG TPA: hypothetical protein VEF34_20175, partial [Syntrophobacteraceae bacterium]|nr:hypothetical protein [Syntrophobacteraceae bacterium]
MKSKHQADSMILGGLTAAAVPALFCAIFISGVSGTPACAQTLGVPTINADAKMEIKQPDAASVPRAGRPVLPADTLTAPLPDRHGCFHLVHDFWEEVPCATDEQMKNLSPSGGCTFISPQNGILSSPHSILGWTGQKIPFTVPIVWGEVATQLSNPEQSTEKNVLGTTKTPNKFSIQTNTNEFLC